MKWILAALTRAGPWFIKQLPKLWPLLLEPKNRKWVQDTLKDLSSQSPGKRLKAKLELTAAIADQIAADATSEDERRQAEEWARRGRSLSLRIDMPVVGREARRAHKHSVRRQLEALQAEMDSHLGASTHPSAIPKS